MICFPEGDMSMNNQIFISYSHNDRETVDRIVEIIRQTSGREVWYDPELAGGDQYFKYIANKIQGCTDFAFIVSEGSITSSWCLKEIAYAMNQHKRIIPIWLRSDVQIPAEIEMVIQDTQYIYYADTDAFKEEIRKTFGDAQSKEQQAASCGQQMDANAQEEPVCEPKEGKKGAAYIGKPLAVLCTVAVVLLALFGARFLRSSDMPAGTSSSANDTNAGTTTVETQTSLDRTTTETAAASDASMQDAEILETAATIAQTGEILDLINTLEPMEVTIDDAQIQRMSVGGPLVHSNDYTLEAESDGTYRLWCENVAIGTTDGTGMESVYMHITDASGNAIAGCQFYEDGAEVDTNQPGETITTDTGVWASSDAQGITLEGVHEGDVFLVETDAVDGTTYALCVGMPRYIPGSSIGNIFKTNVTANITYRNQIDVYQFAPSVGSSATPRGTVRLELTPAENGEVGLYIRDHEGNYLKTYPEYEPDGTIGCTIQFDGDPCTIEVRDLSTSFDAAYSYTLAIHPVIGWTNIGDYDGVHDCISFKEQINVYSYTAASSGTVTLAFTQLTGDWTEDGQLYVYVYSDDAYDAGGEPLAGSMITTSHASLEADLIAGRTYKITVVQTTDYPEYTMVLIKP